MNRLRVCFLLLAVVMTVLGWNTSRPAVFLLWALLCVEELVALQNRHNRKGDRTYTWYKPLLFMLLLVCIGLTIVSIA